MRTLSQFVRDDSSQSNPTPARNIVLQGSILDPLLLLLCMNDMHRGTNLNRINFADYSSFLVKGICLNHLTIYIISEINKKYIHSYLQIAYVLIPVNQVTQFLSIKLLNFY